MAIRTFPIFLPLSAYASAQGSVKKPGSRVTGTLFMEVSESDGNGQIQNNSDRRFLQCSALRETLGQFRATIFAIFSTIPCNSHTIVPIRNVDAR